MGAEGDDNTYIKIGPVGNSNGNEWDEKGHTDIVQIFISYDDDIKSIQFQYAAANSDASWLSERHGTNSGNKFDAVRLNPPIEYIKSISGYKSHHRRDLCSITFTTNLCQYGPFGKFSADEDEEFSLSLGKGRQFGGFHGTADRNTVRSIGVYLKPIVKLPDSTAAVELTQVTTETWEVLD